MDQIWLTTNEILGEHKHTQLSAYCLWLFLHYNEKVEQLWQKSLPFGPLQKKSNDPALG